MFGNVKPLNQELKIRDYSNYRAYYCGLCKSMGGKYAGLCRLGLSYEAVFIAIIISAMLDDKVMVKQKRCFIHPFSKRPMRYSGPFVSAIMATGRFNFFLICFTLFIVSRCSS